MSNIELSTIPASLRVEMNEAIQRAMSGVRDPVAMKKACDDMDRLREEIQREHGELDIGVPAIRELRDS